LDGSGKPEKWDFWCQSFDFWWIQSLQILLNLTWTPDQRTAYQRLHVCVGRKSGATNFQIV
jgi:hypothetical protein